MNNKKHSLFSVYGIEIEYMIVDAESLDVKPIADQLIQELAGSITNEVAFNNVAISNELALHLIEIKTNGPTAELASISADFSHQLTIINEKLKKFNAKLLSTGAHPWLNPHTEIQLWPHGDRSIYDTYNRIFDCKGHGWGNLQATHINLPFANDVEFKKLHSAIRLLLPIIPALSASTPLLEGKYVDANDGRLIYYSNNQIRIPEISGQIIPEFVGSYAEYQKVILKPMYQAIASIDTEKILQYEWLNSRGAIARFDRNAIEIRIVDAQESPAADLAIINAVVGVLKYIIDQTEAYINQPLATQNLKLIYKSVIESGSQTRITDQSYFRQFNIKAASSYTANELWQLLLDKAAQYIDKSQHANINYIVETGNLSERIKRKLGTELTHAKIKELYQEFSKILADNKLFII